MTFPSAYQFGSASQALPRLAGMVMNGDERMSRVGATRELNNVMITLLDPAPFEITTPGRKVSLPAQIAETMWLLAGRNDVEWLANYLPRAAEFSDDGKVWRGGYGPRLRAFAADNSEAYAGVDQLRHVVELLIEDRDTRRAVMSIYDPAVDTEPGKDIPCNNWLHFLYHDDALNLSVTTRSNDLMWGWSGINTFEWSALLHIVAKLTGLRPGRLTFNISSLHLYEHHFAKATRLAAAGTRDLPRFRQSNPAMAVPDAVEGTKEAIDWLDDLVAQWFTLEERIRTGVPGCEAAIASFPEPMLQSWLAVLLAWHTGRIQDLPMRLSGTSLEYALAESPSKPQPEPEPTPKPEVLTAVQDNFLKFVQGLHAEKDAAYGDSWCRRGEQMAIMANIARKVDRLGVEGAGDTAADTAIDMAVYLVKYGVWHQSNKQGRTEVLPFTGPEHVKLVNDMLAMLPLNQSSADTDDLVAICKERFDVLERLVKANTSRGAQIQALASYAWQLAYRLWTAEQKREAWQAGNATRPFNGYNDPEGA